MIAVLLAIGCSSSSTRDSSMATSSTARRALEAEFDFDISYDQTGITSCPARAVRLVDKSLGEPTTWLWTFPDGTTSVERTPTYSSGSPAGVSGGDVTLVVTNGAERSEKRRPLDLVAC